MVNVSTVIGVQSGIEHGCGLVGIASASKLVIQVKAYAGFLAEIGCEITFDVLLTGTLVAAFVIIDTYMGRLGIGETEIGRILYPIVIGGVKDEILGLLALKPES